MKSRSSVRKAASKDVLAGAVRRVIERLEERCLLAGVWVEQGPASILNSENALLDCPRDGTGKVNGPCRNPVAGAVTSIAAHPTDPNIVIIGTVNGGLWRTIDGGAGTNPKVRAALAR